ncbi:unnamed protein product [Parnassius apollo]|uniref:(apollo) hypothetical protein n=1 Tax=Parnassius apollo TaxID=110799 RepID=A0A8S3WBS7_PARAO|nr:unnamed protein product [Parnassius apollo]
MKTSSNPAAINLDDVDLTNLQQLNNILTSDSVKTLEDGADSEDGLDFDDDSLADPDFLPELETFEDDNVALDIDMDSLIETLEDDHENPSNSAEISPSNVSVPQLSPAQDNQQMSKEQSQGKDLPRNNPEHDRIFKIRPVVDSLNEVYSKVPLEEHLCVDEQMCSTKARNTLTRYNSNKPHKWGYKIFVLSGVSGFAYKTEIETGKENVVLQEEPDLGASSNVVTRLARIIPRHQTFQLYFDNYFTSLRLLEYLAKEASSILSSADFRQEVAVTLCKMGTKSGMSGRRSLETEIQAKKRKGPAQYVPPMAVRQDQIGHWPQWSEKKNEMKAFKRDLYRVSAISLAKMAASITRDVRVRVKATYFDENDGQNSWSRKHFGDNYDISYCWGIVRKVENNYARVYSEIDKKNSLVPVGVLIADIENDNLLEANTNEENSSSESGSSSSSEDDETTVSVHTTPCMSSVTNSAAGNTTVVKGVTWTFHEAIRVYS